MHWKKSERAVVIRVKRDRLLNEVRKFDKRSLKRIGNNTEKELLDRYDKLDASSWLVAMTMLAVRRKDALLKQVLKGGWSERFVSLIKFCEEAGVDFASGELLSTAERNAEVEDIL